MIVQPTFSSWQCTGQRIFLRADLNVPFAHGTLLSDRRLRAIQPTLDYLLKKGAQIILASHIGRPTAYDPALSTKQLMPWFKKHGYTLQFAESIAAISALPITPNSIILFENLRFFPGEKGKSNDFAQQLAATAPWYVNDAFGSLHRDDTSLTLLAACYPPDRRSIGYLIEKELTILHHLRQNPEHPVCFILGGGKVADKLPLITALCSFADTIILCPALVFTFLKADGKQVGTSFVEATVLPHIPTIIQTAQNSKTRLVFPLDYQIARHDHNGPLSYVTTNQFPPDGFGISIGPKTIAHISTIINSAATIFYNGMMGFAERKETLYGIKAVMQTMSESSATTLVAGGDSIAIVDELGLGITHCITGGGSTLTYLSNQSLPGLQPFLKDGTKTNKTQSIK